MTRLPAFRRVRLGLGLTFQTNRAYHTLSVRQNLEAPPQGARNKPHGRSRGALSTTRSTCSGSTRDRTRPARELPHHQLQWLEIAMVLAGGPDLLLLDEPTAGMSPDRDQQTARVLQHLNADGLTIVVVEHDMAFVREVAQGVTVLHRARVRRRAGRRDHRARGRAPHLSGAGLSHGPPSSPPRTCARAMPTGDVLQGVGVTAAPGEVVGVLGRNGVGKSTLMRTLIGLLPARVRNDPVQGPGHHPAERRPRGPGAASATCRRGARSFRI